MYERFTLSFSPGSDPHQDGAQHPGGGGARVHREAALRLPDRGQALPHPGLSQGRRPLHQAVQRGERKNWQPLDNDVLQMRNFNFIYQTQLLDLTLLLMHLQDVGCQITLSVRFKITFFTFELVFSPYVDIFHMFNQNLLQVASVGTLVT